MACRSRDVVVCWIVQILFEFWSLLSKKLFRISVDLIFLFRCRSLETIKIGCQLWCFISMFNLQHNYHCMDYTINCIGIFTICSSLSIWPFLFVCIFVEIHCSDDILCECLVNVFRILKLQGIEWWMQIFWYGNDEWYDEMKLVINRDDESLLTLLDKIILFEWICKKRRCQLNYQFIAYLINVHPLQCYIFL